MQYIEIDLQKRKPRKAVADCHNTYSVDGSSRFTVRTQLLYGLIKTHTVQTIYLFRPKLSKIITAILTSTRTPVNKYSPLT